MLLKKISTSKPVNDLSDDTSRMLFSWTISHLDVEGRIHGDPCVLRSTVAPRLAHITDEVMERCIAEWVAEGLVIWYEAKGDRWLQFLGFADNQPGLRSGREAPSFIPAPTPELLRSNSGPTPEQLRVQCGLREGKGREGKRREEDARAREDTSPDSPDPEPDFGDEEPPALPAHQLLACAWYKRFHRETGKLIAPSEKDNLEALKACARMSPKILEDAIEPYFARPFWFTRDKRTQKPSWSFGSFLAHIEEITAEGPARPKRLGWFCPHCHKLNTHTGAMCMYCHEDRTAPVLLAANPQEAPR